MPQPGPAAEGPARAAHSRLPSASAERGAELAETSELPQTVAIREDQDVCRAFRQSGGQRVKQALSMHA